MCENVFPKDAYTDTKLEDETVDTLVEFMKACASGDADAINHSVDRMKEQIKRVDEQLNEEETEPSVGFYDHQTKTMFNEANKMLGSV